MSKHKTIVNTNALSHVHTLKYIWVLCVCVCVCMRARVHAYIHTVPICILLYVYTHAHTLFNPLNAELNSICHMLVLLGAHPILHISKIRVNMLQCHTVYLKKNLWVQHNLNIRLCFWCEGLGKGMLGWPWFKVEHSSTQVHTQHSCP
jgi:hypothetical protein